LGIQEPCKDNIAVYDIIGRYVMERVIGVCESGVLEIWLDMRELMSGVYEICAMNKYGSGSRRLVIIK